jgi:acyl carrier protein
MDNVYERIVDILERLFDIEKILVTEESTFDDLGIDSLKKVELYLDV